MSSESAFFRSGASEGLAAPAGTAPTAAIEIPETRAATAHGRIRLPGLFILFTTLLTY
jgi:hypothetical protein